MRTNDIWKVISGQRSFFSLLKDLISVCKEKLLMKQENDIWKVTSSQRSFFSLLKDLMFVRKDNLLMKEENK